MPENVLYEKQGHLVYVTLNRPAVHNCIDVAMSEELLAVREEIKADRDVRVAVLTGAGAKAFGSGADLKKLILKRTKAEFQGR
jgi:enoyl-CoA hydratase/carnithine racemase